MQDFIQGVVSKLGTDETTAKAATGGLLGLIKEHADPSDASEMFAKLPGAEALLGAAPKEESGGGLLGAVTGGLGSALGGGGAALGALAKSGLSMDKLGSFVGLFGDFAKPLLGGDLLGRLLAKVPGLDKLTG